MRKTLSDSYEEYKIKHNGKPKHDFSHFITVMNMIDHHRTHIRPKIEWCQMFYNGWMYGKGCLDKLSNYAKL